MKYGHRGCFCAVRCIAPVYRPGVHIGSPFEKIFFANLFYVTIGIVARKNEKRQKIKDF